MRKFNFLKQLSFLILFSACEQEVITPIDTSFVTNKQEKLVLLTERRELIKGWALTCPNRPFSKTPYANEYSEVNGDCYQGDSNQWSGLSCLAAYLAGDSETEAYRCRDVANAQGPDGRWWRGPTKVGIEVPDSFSRDMLNGTLAFLLVQSKRNLNDARDRAHRFKAWVTPNNFRMCLTWTDNRCQITAGVWGLLYQVWETLGLHDEMYRDGRLDKSTGIWTHPDLFIQNMLNNDVSYVTELPFVNLPPGFETHLVVVNLLLRRTMNIFDQNESAATFQRKVINDAAQRIYQKQPENPFYSLIANGISDQVIEKALQLCPKDKPNYAEVNALYFPGAELKQSDWSWQRDTKDQSWRRASGHDCIFLINLMITELKKL